MIVFEKPIRTLCLQKHSLLCLADRSDFVLSHFLISIQCLALGHFSSLQGDAAYHGSVNLSGTLEGHLP